MVLGVRRVCDRSTYDLHRLTYAGSVGSPPDGDWNCILLLLY